MAGKHNEKGHGPGDGHDHSKPHSHTSGASEKAVLLAMVLTGGFMLVEVAGGLISGSLALLADAGHMLTDFAALLLAWLGFRIARRPADARRSYGFDRFSVLAAFVNGIALFVLAVWIVVEAYHRIQDPNVVQSTPMLIVAVIGLGVNVLAFWVLSRGDKSQLNMRAALLHVAGDLLGSVAAIVAALVIMATGWFPIDPILSVFVALIILRSAWYVVKDSGHILLEGAPSGVDTDAIREALVDLPYVQRVHHIHAWSISEERPMVTLHALVDDATPTPVATKAIKARLKDRFGLDHCTVEIDHEHDPDHEHEWEKGRTDA